MILLTQVLIHFGFLKALDIPTALNNLQFALLAVATLCIAAAGYIINNLNDIDGDRINKPDRVYIPKPFSETQAFNIYLIFNIAGVGLGFVLSYMMGLTNFATFFVLVSALLYVYANFLKRVLIIGNLVVSMVVAAAIFIVILYDMVPLLEGYSNELMTPILILRDYALFALMLNFLREIVKDIEDANGDYSVGINSLPILIGLERTAKISAYIAVFYIFTILGYIYFWLQTNVWTSIYLVTAVVVPLVYFCIKARYADKKTHYSHLSFVLKLIMLSGILSLGVLTLTLKF